MIKWLILAVTFTIFFGYIGILAYLSIIIFYFILKTMKKDEDIEVEEELSDEKSIIELDEIIKNESIRNFDANRLETYKEIIYSGTQDEKIELIGMVVFNPSREYVGLIRQLLNDDDETIRILASNSLQKMENYFENRIEALTDDLKKEEEIEIYLNLIDTYDKFIESTLLESFLTPEYENKIFKIFDKILILNDADVKKSFLTMSVKYNMYEKIIEDLKRRIKVYNNSYDRFLLAEIYYKENKIDLIKDILKDIKRKEIKDIKLKK